MIGWRSVWMGVAAAVLVPAAGMTEAPPSLRATRLETRSGAGDLAAALRRASVGAPEVWIAWSVPVIEGYGDACCFGGRGMRRGCRLDGRRQGITVPGDEPGGGRGIGSDSLVVYARFESGAPRAIQAYSGGCPVEAGDSRVVWLDGVQPPASIGWLRQRAVEAEHHGPADEAMLALALHADDRADQALRELAAPAAPPAVRENAIFWLGQARGRAGAAELARMAGAERDVAILEKVAFSLSQSPVPEAGVTLEGLVLRHRDARVRAEAIFWLGQRADAGIEAKLLRAAQQDPDLEVRKKAIFALSQLGDGVSALVDLARHARETAIRKEALFWLGQSDDPRAMESLEALLLKP